MGPTKVRKQAIDSFLSEWNPIWGAAGAMTITNPNPLNKKFSVESNLLDFQLIAEIDIGGVVSDEITFTLPSKLPVASAEYTDFSGQIEQSGIWVPVIGIIRPTYAEIRRADGNVFATGTGLKISCSGKYEIANS